MTKWRCTYDEGMNGRSDVIWRLANGVAVIEGETTSICHHEAAHTVARFACGFSCGPTLVRQTFARREGLLYASATGVSYPARAEPLPELVKIPEITDKSEIIRGLDDADDAPVLGWQDLVPPTMISMAGNAAARKYCISKDLPVLRRSMGDLIHAENLARDVWNACSRDGDAFLKFAWRATQKILDIPEVWRAVCLVADELFRGLVVNSKPVPLHGDVVQYAMPGPTAEYLAERAGCRFGMFREEHDCKVGACLRSRPISKRWRARVESALEAQGHALLEAAQ